MNKSIFIIIAGFSILAISIQQAQAIFEDQFYICAETYDNKPKEINCLIIINDDFFNKTQIDQLNTQFNNNLDTFNSNYLLD